MTSPPLPLSGIRVLEYAQYVAGPFAGMLLADLGADVVKVEPPSGDAWRHYEPFAPGESRYFYSLNRNKRSVTLDLKSAEGRAASEALVAGADAVLHNMPPARARRFGLDRERVRELNPDAVWCCVSALGSDGPEADLTAFDLVAQALSGLLLANAQGSDGVPRRAGGIAMADFTAGLLAALAVVAGLLGRQCAGDGGHSEAGGVGDRAGGADGGDRAGSAGGRAGSALGIEVSLLGAALAVQAQRFVSVESLDRAAREGRDGAPPLATPADLQRQALAQREADALEPYYRAYSGSDGFFVLACLHEGQRRAAAAVLGLEDPWAANPQAPPADEAERERRLALVAEFERRLAAAPAQDWVARFRAAGIPAAEVRLLEQLFEHDQALANGLVQSVEHERFGEVKLLGSPFKIDGMTAPGRRAVPGLGEHNEEVLAPWRSVRS